MPVAWYIVPYVRITPAPSGLLAQRALALTIDAPNFRNWREVEVLGNRAIVKVNAAAGVLAQLDAAYKRLPDPDTQLSSLSNAAQTRIQNELEDMGYTVQEIAARLPNPLGTYTMHQVLRFMATKRRKARYDSGTDSIVFDGAEVACGDIDALDRAVT